MARVTHGQCRGGRRPAEYEIWSQMLRRCSNPRNPNFRYYGERGIVVCERWKSFQDFLCDMGPRPSPLHSLDRIDNDGNYEPGNCRWATRDEQMRNTRRTQMLTFNGETMCRKDWASRVGLTVDALRGRLRRGWDLSRALATETATQYRSNK
jgi:hypothetical protein